jgi:hypothetical protein
VLSSRVMAAESNPYAAPRADVNAGAGGPYATPNAFWRSGPILMTRHGAVLPGRCVKCNAEAQESLKKQRFYWHHQAWFALVLANAIIYVVVAMIVRRHADVTYCLCAPHKQQRKRGVFLGVGGILFSLVLIFVGIANNQAALTLIAVLGFLVSIVIAIVKGRTLLPVRIDKAGAQFKGCCEAFLSSLPSS